MMVRRTKMFLLAVSAVAGLGAEEMPNAAEKILGEVNMRLEREFISAEGLVLDYVGDIPAAEDIAELRPNAMGWWTPIENGSMFTGEWLPALMSEGPGRKALVERCVRGLVKMSEVSEVPGFIARGTGKDGKSHYPCGSNDQTDPWFFGLLEYCRWQHADPALKARVAERVVQVAKALEANGWGVPCDGAFKGEDRGNLLAEAMPFWGKTRLLYTLKSLHLLTADPHWGELYDGIKADGIGEIEAGGEIDAKNFKHCFDCGIWIYVSSVQMLARLVEMEDDALDKERLRNGLLHYAARVAPLMERRAEYDNEKVRPFKYANWRDGYNWRPQKTQGEAESVAYSPRRDVLGDRKAHERDFMAVPLAAAAVCALADREKYHDEVMATLRHYDYATPNISEFFHAAIAASAMMGVPSASAKSLKVLMIGNSYSHCLLEEWPQCAASAGDTLDLASLFIGACSLSRHWANIEKSSDLEFKPYAFAWNYASAREKTAAPVARLGGKTNIPQALVADKWDIVTIQQVSISSPFPDSYEPYAGKLIAKIRELAPQAEIVVQETWSYAPYDRRLKKTPAEMHAAIKKAYTQLAERYKIRMIPMGDAVQLYRQRLPVDYGRLLTDDEIAAIPEPTLMDFHGDVVGSSRWSKGNAWSEDRDVYRLRLDSIHLNREGRFLQALVWQATLFGTDVGKLTYRPSHITEEKADLMRKCAMDAVHDCPACTPQNKM